ncbi:MAG: hypothetical protein ACLRWQ_03620 [Flavonifractor plautii]
MRRRRPVLTETQLYTYAGLVRGAAARSTPWARRWSGAAARTVGRARPGGGFSDAPRPGRPGEGGRVSVVAGNPKLLEEAGMPLTRDVPAAAEAHLQEGCTVIYLAAWTGPSRASWPCRTPCGPRRGQVIQRIERRRVQPVLLTGDNENAARAHRRAAGHSGRCRAGCLPEDKLQPHRRRASRRAAGLHDRRRDQRRPRPEEGPCGHRHGRGGQRHRRGRGGHRPGERRACRSCPTCIWPCPSG